MRKEENVNIVREIYANFGRGNIPSILNVLADDIVFKQPTAGPSPLAGTYHGPEQVGEWFGKLDEVAESQNFEPREFIAQGNKVIVLGYYKFLAKPTNKTWEAEWVMVWTFKESKVVGFQFFGDTAAETAAFS